MGKGSESTVGIIYYLEYLVSVKNYKTCKETGRCDLHTGKKQEIEAIFKGYRCWTYQTKTLRQLHKYVFLKN